MNNFLNTVPKPVRIIAGVIFCLAVLIGVIVGLVHSMRTDRLLPFGVGGPFLGLLTGCVVAIWVMCLGYVYADARRRAMPPVLWVLVAVLVPNLLGFLLYFVLRRPIAAPCPRCGRAVAMDQRFCSWCGYEVSVWPPSPPAHPNMGPSSAV